MRRRAGCLWLAAATLVVTLRALHSFADPPATQPTDIPESLRHAFADLASSDASAREKALDHLMGLSFRDLDSLERLVEESQPLAPSQAMVLHQIVTHVYLSGIKYEADPQFGFLGIKLTQTVVSFKDAQAPEAEPPAGPGGVVVVERMPGFCGARYLRDGDVILSMAEQPHLLAVRNLDVEGPLVESFARAVKDTGAGQTIHLEVLRQGQVVRVAVTLDARPEAADEGPAAMDVLLERRRAAAESYWEQNVASLVRQAVSAIPVSGHGGRAQG